MALLGYRVDVAESELRALCDCTPFGTEALRAVDAARKLGFARTAKHTLTLTELRREIERGLYPIVYVNLLPLDGIKDAHAFVAVAQSEDSIMVYDPLRGERTLTIFAFATAWAAMRNLVILLER